ncbi:MAG: hypothetical protein OXF60_02330 [Gammaproteobacteria bacterium]|nr:hypothetical protein [Gammaproteobacteria bacterium]
MITNKTKNSAIRAYEIMKDKNYTPEEIETFLAFLDQQVIEVTQPQVEHMNKFETRLDRLETRFNFGFWILAILILTAPGLLQDVIKITLGF